MGAPEMEDAAAGGEGAVLRAGFGLRLSGFGLHWNPRPAQWHSPKAVPVLGFRVMDVYNRGDFEADEVTSIAPSWGMRTFPSAIASTPTRRSLCSPL